MYCSKCGTQIDSQAAFCSKCGAPTSAGTPTAAGAPTAAGTPAPIAAPGVEYKSKLAAGLLGIFLGEFGIHRFYLGFVGIGILQIVVSFLTLGIGGLWGFIEGIVILAGGFDKDAKGLPLRD